MSDLKITYEQATSPELTAMHEARIAYGNEGYNPADVFTPDIGDLEKETMRFRIALLGGERVGMGALRIDPAGWGEVKAVYVVESARGKGVARAIMEALEAIALAEGVTLLRLETGTFHAGALKFYPRLGWREIPRFDPYPVNETSIFFEKRLA